LVLVTLASRGGPEHDSAIDAQLGPPQEPQSSRSQGADLPDRGRRAAWLFFHLEADWRDVLRTASEISAENAFARSCPGTDLLHVAYAKEFAAELFVSFDDEQLLLAQAAGLKAVNPAKRPALSS